ncbi:hypothetical protein U1769_25470, partial [Sphingomonas sp. ZT3P38]|uniref:hypothetical protein n=1 Tax=Parasphingomonas zepuensis TaxID=3096161 RepID=UPI002FC6B707
MARILHESAGDVLPDQPVAVAAEGQGLPLQTAILSSLFNLDGVVGGVAVLSRSLFGVGLVLGPGVGKG